MGGLFCIVWILAADFSETVASVAVTVTVALPALVPLTGQSRAVAVFAAATIAGGAVAVVAAGAVYPTAAGGRLLGRTVLTRHGDVGGKFNVQFLTVSPCGALYDHMGIMLADGFGIQFAVGKLPQQVLAKRIGIVLRVNNGVTQLQQLLHIGISRGDIGVLGNIDAPVGGGAVGNLVTLAYGQEVRQYRRIARGLRCKNAAFPAFPRRTRQGDR